MINVAVNYRNGFSKKGEEKWGFMGVGNNWGCFSLLGIIGEFYRFHILD